MVGDEDLIASILESGGGGLQFDKCIATPEMMPKLSKVGAARGSCFQGRPADCMVTPSCACACVVGRQLWQAAHRDFTCSGRLVRRHATQQEVAALVPASSLSFKLPGYPVR